MKNDYEIQWKQLNEFQWAAVTDDSPACVVKANVGSGKTTVLINKILYLHTQKQVPLRDMTVLTFTNKAAGEIRQRLLLAEPELNGDDLTGFGTFHSVAMNLLKTRLPVENAGWTKDFMVMTPDEEVELALRIAKRDKLKIKYKNRLKKRLEMEYEAYTQGQAQSRYKDDQLFSLFAALKAEKQRQDKMTFSDLIEVSTALLQEYEPKPAWIIVDEVQDSDHRQIEFITALMGTGTKLFAVGDPNQVIYSWRGSMETMFYYLKRQFQAKELTLPINYRSSQTILEAAGRFLQFGNEVAGNRDGGQPIRVRNHYDPFQEAQYLAQRVKELHQSGMDYGDMAIFYRLQSQSEIIEKVFDNEGVPYAVTMKKTIQDIPVLDWFVKVLRYSCNPKDTYAADVVLNHPRYGGSQRSGSSHRGGISQHSDGSQLYGVSQLLDRMLDFNNRFASTSIPAPEDIYSYFALDDHLKPNSATYGEDRAMVLDFCGRLTEYARENPGDGSFPTCSLSTCNLSARSFSARSFSAQTARFLSPSALYGIEILTSDENPGKDKVRLMTLHASKGLEFSCVFIIGVNQGLIPLTGKSFEAEEEERRLFFVGMTRARELLELSYYTNPEQPRTAGGPGRYLNMLPRHLLDWDGGGSPQERQANLQQLRQAVRQEQRQVKAQPQTEVLTQTKALQQTEVLTQTEGLRQGAPHPSTDQLLEGKSHPQAISPPQSPRRARHPKYGIGTLISENEMTLEVDFPGYGKKEFLKAFSEVELLD